MFDLILARLVHSTRPPRDRRHFTPRRIRDDGEGESGVSPRRRSRHRPRRLSFYRFMRRWMRRWMETVVLTVVLHRRLCDRCECPTLGPCLI
jgi:hypothetical protein